MWGGSDIISRSTEGASYLRKEVFSDTTGGDSRQHAEALRRFSSNIDGLKNLDTKLQKINALRKTQPKIDILSTLNKILPSQIATHNSDNPDVQAYFSKQWDNIVLVVNNIVWGKEVMNSESDMRVLLQKIDSMINEQKISEIAWQGKNPDTIIRAYEASIRSYWRALQETQATYQGNTDVMSSVLDIGNNISNVYKQSFESTKNTTRASYVAFLKEYATLKETRGLSSEQERKLELIKKTFEKTLASKFETVSLWQAMEKNELVQAGEYFLKDLKSWVVRDHIFAGMEWEAKGLYNSTIGFVEFLFKVTTDEKVRASLWQALWKLWEYTKTNCTEPGKVWNDVVKALYKEMDKIKNLPPEQQAHMVGDIFGNIMGTILLGKWAGAIKNNSILRVKYAPGTSALEKITEIRNVRTWEHLESYVESIDHIRFKKWMSGQTIQKLVRGVQDGTVKIWELPKSAGIRQKAAELLKYGGEIPEAEGLLNTAVSKAGGLTISWVQKTGKLIWKTMDSQVGKGVKRISSTIKNESIKWIAHIGMIVAKIEQNLQLLKKLEATLSAPGKAYDKVKWGIEASGEGYARNMTLKTLNHLEETLSTLKENFQTLGENIAQDPGVISILEQTVGSLRNDIWYLLERLIKDPLFVAKITERWALIAPIQKNIWSLIDISGDIIWKAKKGVLKWVKASNITIGSGKTSESHWINKMVNSALEPKEALKFSGGMAKVVREVETVWENGEKVTKELIGFKDYTGKMVIEPAYETANEFKYGYSVVSKDGKMSIIDKKGNLSHLDIEVNKVTDIRITKDSKVFIQITNNDVSTIWIFDIKTKKYIFEPTNKIEWVNNSIDGVLFMKDWDTWNLLTNEGELIKTAFKTKPEESLAGFIAKDVDGWRIITKESKLVDVVFKTKPEGLWVDFIAKDVDWWRVITENGKVIETVFKTKPEGVWIGIAAEDIHGWRVITEMDKLIEMTFKSKPEGFWCGFVAKDVDGWRVITENGKVIETVFKTKPKELWLGFVTKDVDGWRITTREGKLVDVAFENKPKELFYWYAVKDTNGWRVITENGKVIETVFKTKPKELCWLFVTKDTNGWRVITKEGKLIEMVFKTRPEKSWAGLLIKNTHGWRVITEEGKLIETIFKTRPERLWFDFIAKDIDGWRVVVDDNKVVGAVFKSKPELLWLNIIAEDASGWRVVAGNGKLVEMVFKSKPEQLKFGLKAQTNNGVRYISESGDILPGVYKDIRVSLSNGQLQFEQLNGKIFEIDEDLLRSQVTNQTSLINSDSLFSAAVINENIDNLKTVWRNAKKELDIKTTKYIGEEAKHIQPVLEKNTNLEDFFMGLRADNRKMSTSFQSLVNKFSSIDDVWALEKQVIRATDEGIQIYIQNINARRQILNRERLGQGLSELPELSEIEVTHLKGKYAERMEREFMQAIQQEVAIREGRLSSLSPSLWNQESLRKIMGRFVTKEMNSGLYAELGGMSEIEKRIEQTWKIRKAM